MHHGYEIQICDAGDRFHRTGAVYSLAASAAAVDKPPTDWKTMVITLDGPRVLVDVDGRRLTAFDPRGKDVPHRANGTSPSAVRRGTRPATSGCKTTTPATWCTSKRSACSRWRKRSSKAAEFDRR